jgi:hypothetical protein
LSLPCLLLLLLLLIVCSSSTTTLNTLRTSKSAESSAAGPHNALAKLAPLKQQSSRTCGIQCTQLQLSAPVNWATTTPLCGVLSGVAACAEQKKK